MSTLYMQYTIMNSTENCLIVSSGVWGTHCLTKGDLYKECVKEYGRCTGKVHIDQEDGAARDIGWTFVKRMPYSDAPKKTYVQETWVTVHTSKPTKIYHYADV